MPAHDNGAKPAKMILHSTISPDKPAGWTVFTLARKACLASIDVEIHLAGPGTGVLRKSAREMLASNKALTRHHEAFRAIREMNVPIHFIPG